MTQFKTGDKVRVNSNADDLEAIYAPAEANGAEGTVVDASDTCVDVEFPERIDCSTIWSFDPGMLEAINV